MRIYFSANKPPPLQNISVAPLSQYNYQKKMLSANNIEIIPVFQITFEIFPKHYNILGNFLVARIFDPPPPLLLIVKSI